MENLNKLRDIDALKISLATPEEILSWSYGEVTKPETINYRTFKAEKDGLFCEKIFGPVKDYECYCGKYKRIRYKGVVCDRCGVQVTTSKVRRERMGHITLASPVAHVWLFKNIPSVMATLLGIPPRSLALVIYFSSFIVTDIDHEAKKKTLEKFEGLVKEARENAHARVEERISKILSEAEEKVKSITGGEKNLSESVQKKADSVMQKANEKVSEIRDGELVEQEKAELEIRKLEKKLNEVDLHTVMTDKEYLDLEKYLDEFCEVSIGAEAIQKILETLDLQTLRSQLKEEILTAKTGRLKKLRKRLKVVDGFIRGEVDPKAMIVTVLPVIPPDLRPMVQLEGGRFATSDLNDLYRRIINRNNRLKKLMDLGAPEIIIRNEKRMLQEAVDALFDSSKVRKNRTRRGKTYRSLADSIKGKQGYFRANLLGKRVDYSGRSVIVSGPNLKMNECGLPVDMAFELFVPFLLREIMAKGLAPNMKTAKRVLEERSDKVYEILESLVKKRPVLLNRAPTLHRLSIQAFFPKLTDTKAIQLHPVVCSGFNADFDGDQMAVHLPISEEAVNEAIELMLSTNNLLKPADGSIITIPSKEMVLGTYYLTSINENLKSYKSIFSGRDEVLTAMNNGKVDMRQPVKMVLNGGIVDTTPGRVLFNDLIPEELGFINDVISKSSVKKLVKDSLEKAGAEKTIDLIDNLKRYGFAYSTVSGVSLSIFDCEKPDGLEEVVKKAKGEVKKVEQNYQMGLVTKAELSRLTHKVWQKTVDEIDKTILDSMDKENPVRIVIEAGAGKASAVQMRQISAIKGLIADPTGKIIDMPVLGNYANGMSSFDYFLTGRGTRKSYMDKGLGTADAGYLTRRLVNVAQDVLIRDTDCRTTDGRVIKRGEDTPLFQWHERIVGRYAAEDVKDGRKILVKRNELITKEIAQEILNSKLESVKIRSAVTCNTKYGVCAKCYGKDLAIDKPVKIGASVGVVAAQSIGEPGTQLTLRTFHSGGIAQENITQGLPRVEELFEARKPKMKAIISPIAGKVTIKEGEGIKKVSIKPTGEKGEEVILDIESTSELLVETGDLVAPGTQITAGSLDLQEVYDISGPMVVRDYIIDEIQGVYGSQGVAIDDKHVEVIVRQMFNKVKVLESGDTTLLPGEIVTKYKLDEENKIVSESGGEKAKGKPILLGISKASRLSESWLDAASFEETSNVLTESAVSGKVDKLIGLKENVIIGRRIPVGDEARLKN